MGRPDSDSCFHRGPRRIVGKYGREYTCVANIINVKNRQNGELLGGMGAVWAGGGGGSGTKHFTRERKPHVAESVQYYIKLHV